MNMFCIDHLILRSIKYDAALVQRRFSFVWLRQKPCSPVTATDKVIGQVLVDELLGRQPERQRFARAAAPKTQIFQSQGYQPVWISWKRARMICNSRVRWKLQIKLICKALHFFRAGIPCLQVLRGPSKLGKQFVNVFLTNPGKVLGADAHRGHSDRRWPQSTSLSFNRSHGLHFGICLWLDVHPATMWW